MEPPRAAGRDVPATAGQDVLMGVLPCTEKRVSEEVNGIIHSPQVAPVITGQWHHPFPTSGTCGQWHHPFPTSGTCDYFVATIGWHVQKVPNSEHVLPYHHR